AASFTAPGAALPGPDPGYPAAPLGAGFNGGPAYRLPLRHENAVPPDLAAIPADVARAAKLLWLNYPNNPTAAVAPAAFFADAVRFAERHGVILCHDAAYAELYFGERPPSLLEIPGGRDVAIEFHSPSQTCSL